MDPLADELGVHPLLIPTLRREIRPFADLRALLAIRRVIRRERPDVVHTHTAKAGALGRIAALTVRPRPRLIVHTFHGHVLSGYFASRTERIFARVERFLARRTDVLVAVSEEVRDDLLRLGIGRGDQLRVVPLGFDLDRFQLPHEKGERARQSVRSALGLTNDDCLVTIVARLVSIKRIDVFLEAAAIVSKRRDRVRFCVVGDGELADALKGSAAGKSLGDRLIWTGFRDDMPSVYAASDIVVLCSDNEGTPVSLIEALASGVAVVGTRVGGVPSVVTDRATGLLVPPGDPAALAEAVLRLVDDGALRARLGSAGRKDVVSRFALARLVEDVMNIYTRPPPP